MIGDTTIAGYVCIVPEPTINAYEPSFYGAQLARHHKLRNKRIKKS